MSEARATIDGLSKEFDRSVIQTKPGSAKKPATKYVSHGSVTKRLNAVCPGWSSRVVETYTYVNPAGLLVCAGVLLELTIPGVGSRQEFGTANQPRNFGDDAKNAASDALKRAAMRFGVALDLWEDMDEHDEDAAAYPPQGRTLDEALRSGVSPVAPARNAAPAFATPRAAPAPAPAARATGGDEPVAIADDWTAFWSWAKAQNYKGKHDMALALGKTDAEVNNLGPAALRAALEVAHQRAG